MERLLPWVAPCVSIFLSKFINTVLHKLIKTCNLKKMYNYKEYIYKMNSNDLDKEPIIAHRDTETGKEQLLLTHLLKTAKLAVKKARDIKLYYTAYLLGVLHDIGKADSLFQNKIKNHLRKVAKICTNYGQRVQNSVFECSIDSAQLRIIKNKISKIIDFENDSIRFYYMGKNWERKVESMGKDDTYNPDTGTLLL